MVVTATEFKTNLGKYLTLVNTTGEALVITKNGKKIAQMTKPPLSGVEKLASLMDPKGKAWDYDALRKAALEEKYETSL